MTALPAMLLAAALSYAIVDFLKPHLSSGLVYWSVATVLFFVIYKVSNHFLKSLKE